MSRLILPGDLLPVELAARLSAIAGVAPTWATIPGESAWNAGADAPPLYATDKTLLSPRRGDIAQVGREVWTPTSANDRLQYPGTTPASGGFTAFVVCALTSANALANVRLIGNRQFDSANYWELITVEASGYISVVIDGSTDLVYNRSRTAMYNGVPQTYAVTWSGASTSTSAKLYQNGVERTSGSATAAPSALNAGASNDITVGNIGYSNTAIGRGPNGSFYLASVFPGALSAEKIAALDASWRDIITRPSKRVLYFDVAGSGGAVTGTLSATETGADTSAIIGAVQVHGTLAANESGQDSAAFSGYGTAPTITGTLSATESGSDTFASAGKVYISGALSTAELGQDTASFVGDGAAPPITGSVSATESGGDSASVSGKVYVAGTLSAIEGGLDAFAASGDIYVFGTLSAVESGSDTASFTGPSNVTLTNADIAAIADAVWAKFAAEFLPVDVRRVNTITIAGAGVAPTFDEQGNMTDPGDPWVPAP
jgi:hypothetical protein